jgi:type IV pilus assembly protein PilF
MTMLRTWVHSIGWSLAAAVGLMVQLGGCANMSGPTAATTAANNDIATASDESETRKRARIRLELATTYYSQAQYSTALDELKQAEGIDPTMPATDELRALIYDAIGDTRRAEAAFKDALAKDPRNGSVMHNYGWFLCRARQFAAADAMFERAVALPQSMATSKTLLARGVCQVNSGLYAEAEKTLIRSYEVDPSNPATAFNLASVLYRRGDLDRARFYIRRVNSVSSQLTAESLWLAARIEHRLGNPGGRDDLAAQLRSRFPSARETNALELGRFDE